MNFFPEDTGGHSQRSGVTLSPNSDKNEISRYTITTCSNIEATRITEVITKDVLITRQILLTSVYIWRTVRRIITHFHIRD